MSKRVRYFRVNYIVGWEASDSGLLLMYADGQRELIPMSPKEVDENCLFMVDNMFEDKRDVIGIAWDERSSRTEREVRFG